ncbi:BACON domain-containing protein, partial [Hyalangium sp.]|uniref:BACON domain-containing protein n=1 Tax=Hyalangium sp. TaxID=2028555 RepID=UPI002D3F657E
GRAQLFLSVASTHGLTRVTNTGFTNPFTLTVTPKAPAEAGLGTWTDEIVISVCEDTECGKPISGSPRTVSVSYTVRSHIQATPAALSFTSVLGSSALPGSKSLTLQGTSIQWTASASPSWVQLSGSTSGGTPGSLTVKVNATGLPLGSHAGTITLTQTETGDALEVPVTLQVVPPTLSITPLSLSFAAADLPDSTIEPVALYLDTGTSPYSWTATVDTGGGPAWLKLSNTSGTVSSIPALLTASVNIQDMPNGSFSGSVTLCSGGAAQSSDTVKVGLWVGARSPNSQDSLTTIYHAIETEPIRPYVYAHTDDGDLINDGVRFSPPGSGAVESTVLVLSRIGVLLHKIGIQ